MITVCLDTSHIFLVIALLEDGKMLASVQERCWKKQSEELFPKLTELLETTSRTPEEIGKVVVTLGPGSYTGVRIALTFAKVFAAMMKIPVYTLKSLQLCAGMEENVRVLYDARGHRAYQAVYSNGEEILPPEARDIDEITQAVTENELILGDGHLIDK